jgi:hypothetical protein
LAKGSSRVGKARRSRPHCSYLRALRAEEAEARLLSLPAAATQRTPQSPGGDRALVLEGSEFPLAQLSSAEQRHAQESKALSEAADEALRRADALERRLHQLEEQTRRERVALLAQLEALSEAAATEARMRVSVETALAELQERAAREREALLARHREAAAALETELERAVRDKWVSDEQVKTLRLQAAQLSNEVARLNVVLAAGASLARDEQLAEMERRLRVLSSERELEHRKQLATRDAQIDELRRELCMMQHRLEAARRLAGE